MIRISTRLLSLCLTSLLIGSISLGAPPESKAATTREINSWAQSALSDFRTKVPQANQVLKDARGILIFPHLYNAGLLVGGKYAEGELLINNVVSGYYNLIGLSWGWQIGGQRQALIIVFMTDEVLSKFQNSEGWDLGTDATIAVVDSGTQGSISASRLNKPVLAFAVDQKGLMAGLSLQGSKISKLSK